MREQEGGRAMDRGIPTWERQVLAGFVAATLLAVTVAPALAAPVGGDDPSFADLQAAPAQGESTPAPTVPSPVPGAPAPDAARAIRAFEAFRTVFWDGDKQCFYKFSDHREARWLWVFYRADGHSDFWWEAHLFDLCLDAVELTKDARYRQMAQAVFDGFLKHYSIGRNTFNDDLGWWALACTRAFEITHEDRYRTLAVELATSILKYEDSTDGGGVWWKRDGTHPFKNVATNAPLVITLCRLTRITGDARWLGRARDIHSWIAGHLVQDGRLLDGVTRTGLPRAQQYTYNYGTWIGANLALHDATDDASYLQTARQAAREAMTVLAPDGILADEGDGDGSGFKMILTRYLARLAAVDGDVAAFLARNAQTAWDHRRAADDLMGRDWSRPAPGGVIESFAAATGVAVQFHALAARAAASPAP